MSGTRKKQTAARAKPAPRSLTIYDREKYFDATFSAEERDMIRARIMAETGFEDRYKAIRKAFDLVEKAETELEDRLNMYPVPPDWTYIHLCKQLEIDYKSFERNIPKLPIEPFYVFVAPLFPQFKPVTNKYQISIQTNHLHLAFIDWIDEVCACGRSFHGFACWDRFEHVSYEEGARRIWEFNARRQKFTSSPLRIVHSRD